MTFYRHVDDERYDIWISTPDGLMQQLENNPNFDLQHLKYLVSFREFFKDTHNFLFYFAIISINSDMRIYHYYLCMIK